MLQMAREGVGGELCIIWFLCCVPSNDESTKLNDLRFSLYVIILLFIA